MEWNLWEMENGFADSCKDGGGVMDDMVEEGSVLSGEAMIGLKLGRPFPFLPSSVKRSRASYQSCRSPRCQVQGCNLDLTSAKDYHRRHRICVDHSKSPKVVVAGMERRFCQQCSRLHDLSEFDERKRSCRRRLSAHNARRRRPQSEDMHLSSTHRRAHMSIVTNELKGGDDSSNSFHDGFEANSNSIYAMDVRHAFSHPTTSSWGFNGLEEPTSFDQFVHGHSIGLTQVEIRNNHNDQIPPHDFDSFCSD